MRIIVRTRPITAATPNAVSIAPANILVRSRPQRVLDFDIENRPLSYLGSDFTTAEVTAIAWAWCDQPEDVSVYLLGEHELPDILTRFVAAYNHADMVTGHYIRGHDLPMLNGALVECWLPPLQEKTAQDTKLDFIRTKGISLSQESMGALLRLEADKVTMNQIKWRAANRLTPEGLAEVRKRVVGDVRQHILMRREMLQRGLLTAPILWKSGVRATAEYVP